MKFVEGLSAHEIHRRTGLHRKTIRRALESDEPPRYARPPRPSKLDPFRDEIKRLLQEDPRIPAKRIRELIEEQGYAGGKSILDDHVRELRPLYARRRTYQRTIYRPGELLQFDLWEPKLEIPVGHGRLRRGYVVTAELGYSRAFAAALVFSKEFCDIAFGMSRCLSRLGALPEKLVWDREGAIHAGGGRPTDAFAAFCGQLGVGWVILDAGDAQAKGVLERSHRFMRTNFEPARRFANPLDFQLQLDGWCDRVNRRGPRTIRAVPAERLAGGAGGGAAPPPPRSGWPRSTGGCKHCRPRCPTAIAARSCACRSSRSCASIATTTRSTPCSPADGSRSASRSPRSPRSCSTPASWRAGTAAASPAGSRSPTRAIRASSTASAS